MSTSSYTEFFVTVDDDRYETDILVWASKHDGWYVGQCNGSVQVSFQAYNWYSDGAFKEIRDTMADFPVPCSEWVAEGTYENYDYSHESGSMCEFAFENGKFTMFKENRITMVDCEPWYFFDLSNKEEE